MSTGTQRHAQPLLDVDPGTMAGWGMCYPRLFIHIVTQGQFVCSRIRADLPLVPTKNPRALPLPRHSGAPWMKTTFIPPSMLHYTFLMQVQPTCTALDSMSFTYL